MRKVHRRFTVVVALVAALALLATACGSDDDTKDAGGASGGSEAPAGGKTASEVGISADEIHIAVIADVDNAAAPGLFKGSKLGVEAYAKYVNGQGGIAGRKLVVDFIDSKLSPDAAQNAVIQACQNDFALVGTSALFLNNISTLTSCKDKAGAATGVPDLAVVQTSFVHQCSPVSYTVTGTVMDCATKDQHPQTYHEPVGEAQWMKDELGVTTGSWIQGNDIKGTLDATYPIVEGEKSIGLKGKGFLVSGVAPQATYTPYVQDAKRTGVDYVRQLATSHNQALALKEAQLQGFKPKAWSCTTACYSKQYLQEAGQLAEGTYVDIPTLPFEETSIKVVKTMVDAIGADQIDGFAGSAWASTMLFQEAVERAVDKVGEDGLTRASLLEALAGIHDFGAGGLYGTNDVGAHRNGGCFVILQVKGGAFTRVYPKKAGTFDCDEDNMTTVQFDNK